MAYNHSSVNRISSLAFSSAEKQARWRERHLDSSDGTKTRLQFIFDVSTRSGSSDCSH
jgi:hypothetical protein